MLYQVTVTVPPLPAKEKALEKVVSVEEEVVTRIAVYFPPGPCNLLKVALFYGAEQIWPHRRYEWLSGEDVLIEDALYFKCPERPCPLRILAYNEDDTYEHSCIVYITAHPKHVALVHEFIARIARFWQRFAELVGM